jgi:4,5-DOPA dioxygenase extradiol
MTNSFLSPVLYFPHGGGPLPLLGDASHLKMKEFLRNFNNIIIKPESILVISAHWEENAPTITSGKFPPLIYDYYGFPEESYQIKYPAPGNPGLADIIYNLMNDNGLNAVKDDNRGFDHGLFVPLKIMYPEASISCVQLSLNKNLDPASHILIGKALSELRKMNVLILGSGFSFHNIGEFSFSSNSPDLKNDEFQEWLSKTCTDTAISEVERTKYLIEWKGAPFAKYCHPREEHLLPLHVCYGIARSSAKLVFDDQILGKRSIALLW